MDKTIGNPLSFVAKAFKRGSLYVGDGVNEIKNADVQPIEIRDIQVADLKVALRKGFDDFTTMRTDVMFIALIYPIIGLILAWFVVNQNLLHLLFPIIAGFALLGPVFAVGLYEMSRRREEGLETGWNNAFDVVKSPAFTPIVILGGYLFAIFLAWNLTAFVLYGLTMGPASPVSASSFLVDVFTTSAGWAMLIVGLAIGFVFAAVVLATSVVSFPLLLDRHVGLPMAVVTSFKVTKRNPTTVALWGVIVVGMLGLGVATLFVGLILVLPILGHATWHLYRQAVVHSE